MSGKHADNDDASDGAGAGGGAAPRSAPDGVDYKQRVERMLNRAAGNVIPAPDRSGSGAGGSRSKILDQGQYVHKRDSVAERVLSISRHLVTEAPRQTPVLATCDVLVVGGGPAGLSAALGARRAGADVILMDRFGCFGGVITTVGMETLGWYRYEGTSNDTEGIGPEMEKIAQRMGGSTKWPYNDSQCLDADMFKLVADRLVKESGIRPLLHCAAVEVVVQDGCIRGVITESKSGRRAVLAKRVVDCTGDADVAFLAGAPCRMNPPGKRMGVTSVFNVAGVDAQQFIEYTEAKPATYADWSRVWNQKTTGKEDDLRTPYLDTEFVDAEVRGVIPKLDSHIGLGGSWSALQPATGEATNLNLVHMRGIDVTNVFDLTRAEMDGRANTMHALKALQETVPGFQKAKLRNFGMTLGTRDSRKILGRHNLTLAEVSGEARFHDSVGIFPEFIDGYNILVLPTTGRYFQVPLGCLVPLNVDNLLVGGRCVAGDNGSHAATRNMMCCTVTGQGAGVAAAVSITAGTTTASVPVALVQKELTRQKVRIE